jgi:hypothetical protein
MSGKADLLLGSRERKGTSAATAKLRAVGRRLLPVALVVSAAAADARELHEVAFYLLVAAVPAAAVSALSLFGEALDLPGDGAVRLQAALAALGLVLVLVAAAIRGQNPVTEVPPVAVSALMAALGVFAVQAVAALASPFAASRPHRTGSTAQPVPSAVRAPANTAGRRG